MWQSSAFNSPSESCLQKNLSEGIDGVPIPKPVDDNLKDNELLGIGGPPIRCSGILITVHTS